jgi:hypothetical protein
MGMEAFIPTPVSSATFKGNAGVNARRAAHYQNAPTRRMQNTGATSPKPTWVKEREQLLEDKRKSTADQISKIFDPAKRFRFAMPTNTPYKGPVGVPMASQKSAAKEADGIADASEYGPPKPFEMPSTVLKKALAGQVSMKPTEKALGDKADDDYFAERDAQLKRQDEMFRARYGQDWDMTPEQMREKSAKLAEQMRDIDKRVAETSAIANMHARKLRDPERFQTPRRDFDPFSPERLSFLGKELAKMPSWYLNRYAPGLLDNELYRAVGAAGKQLFNLPSSVNESLKRGMPVR